jgi:hypothetical protein
MTDHTTRPEPTGGSHTSTLPPEERQAWLDRARRTRTFCAFTRAAGSAVSPR